MDRDTRNKLIDDNDKSIEETEKDKLMRYDWETEMDIIRSMQKCQRKYDLGRKVKPVVMEYLCWVAQNAPSKQYEAYYDVHWSTNRGVISDLYKWTWGSTAGRNPPSCFRNTQMNANAYMCFVMKQPDTMHNCNNDGTLQDPDGESRWENAIAMTGIGMGLVMQAAHRMGMKTGPHKLIDLGPDYDGYWEKRLGIEEEIKSGKKKFMYGLGIGFPNKNLPRYDGVDPEIAIGASNGHKMTLLDENDPNFIPGSRKAKIVNIKECAGQTIKDPYGNEHIIPNEHRIATNTWRNRKVKAIEIK